MCMAKAFPLLMGVNWFWGYARQLGYIARGGFLQRFRVLTAAGRVLYLCGISGVLQSLQVGIAGAWRGDLIFR